MVTFTLAATQAGFGITHAIPMRLRGQVIGALNLVHDKPVELSDTDLAVAQVMADVATAIIDQTMPVRTWSPPNPHQCACCPAAYSQRQRPGADASRMGGRHC